MKGADTLSKKPRSMKEADSISKKRRQRKMSATCKTSSCIFNVSPVASKGPSGGGRRTAKLLL
jgi:hypothetical protein